MNSTLDNDSSSAMCIACTKGAAILPRLSGGISALSSFLIIFIIFRSSDNLKTVYHRIMFGLSIADICSSVAFGLTTLPLPKELPFEHPPYHGSRLGNTQTCEAQGFFILFGFSAGLTYHVSLFLYNTCTIVFQMKEERIVKCIEPIAFHLLPLLSGLYSATSPLVNKLYNPTKRNPTCLAALNEQKSNLEAFKVLAKYFVLSSLSKILVVIICALLIIVNVFKLEKALYRPRILLRSSRMSPHMSVVNRSLQNTKMAFVHSLSFILVFVLTFGITVLRYASGGESLWLANLSFLLLPSQGFFNFLIFISHKVYNYRRVHGDMSRLDVIKILFRGSEQEPILFSRISLVRMLDQSSSIDVEISDEKDNHEVIHLGIGGNISPSEHSSAHLQFDDESKRNDDFSGFSLSIEPIISNDEEKISQSNSDDIASSMFSSTMSTSQSIAPRYVAP